MKGRRLALLRLFFFGFFFFVFATLATAAAAFSPEGSGGRGRDQGCGQQGEQDFFHRWIIDDKVLSWQAGQKVFTEIKKPAWRAGFFD
jgi:hypothetical protein